MSFKFIEVRKVLIVCGIILQMSPQFISQYISGDHIYQQALSCSPEHCKCSRNFTSDIDGIYSFEIACHSVIDIQFTMFDFKGGTGKVVNVCFSNGFELGNLPEMNVSQIVVMEINGCNNIPDSIPLLPIFKRLGIISIQVLCLRYNNQKQDFPYRGNHFRGLNIFFFHLEAPYLKDLPHDFFTYIPNILELRINNTHFEEFSNAIALLTQLKNLEIRSTAIKRLKAGAFTRMNRLERIHLHHNQLESIGKFDFIGLKKLLDLILSHNRIETIHQDSLLPLNTLMYFYLNENHIKELPVGLLRECRNLYTLDLSNNLIGRIPA